MRATLAESQIMGGFDSNTAYICSLNDKQFYLHCEHMKYRYAEIQLTPSAAELQQYIR